jgi:predicted GNAT family N-acyltransferase
MGIFKYKLHAQVSNKEFYKRLGFKIKGKIFIEAGIEHILMIRKDDTSEYLENKRSNK